MPQGVDYVVAMDADVMLVQDLLGAMWPLMKETQVTLEGLACTNEAGAGWVGGIMRFTASKHA